MADLTGNAPLRFRFPDLLKKERFTLDNSAAQTVYKGAPVIKDVSEDTLYLRGFLAATTTVTATDVFTGIANEKGVVATADTETDNEIELITAGEVGFAAAYHSLTEADNGKEATMTDSGTIGVGSEAAGVLAIGKIVRVEDGWVYVELNAPNICVF